MFLDDQGVRQQPAASDEGVAVVDRQGAADGFRLADCPGVDDGAVGRHGPVDVSLFRPGRRPGRRRQPDALAQSVVAFLGVGLAIVSAGRCCDVGDALDVRDQVDEGGDGARGVPVVLGAVADGRGRDLHRVGAGLKDGDLVGGKVVVAVWRHLRPLRDDDVVGLRRAHREAHGRLCRGAFQPVDVQPLADGVQHLAPRIAEKGLPSGVVEAVVEGDEHGHEPLAEDPALVAGVQRLAGSFFECSDQGVVDGRRVGCGEVDVVAVGVGLVAHAVHLLQIVLLSMLARSSKSPVCATSAARSDELRLTRGS